MDYSQDYEMWREENELLNELHDGPSAGAGSLRAPDRAQVPIQAVAVYRGAGAPPPANEEEVVMPFSQAANAGVPGSAPGLERPLEDIGAAAGQAVAPASAVQARRRKVGKQPPNPDELSRAVARAALADAVGDGDVAALPQGARRKCVHYTHVRTWDIHHVQPCQMTREDFWRHLERCYAEAYPRPDLPHGSILLFGVVVKERHGESARETERAEHKHAPTFSDEAHYWNKVKAVSLEKYRVMLNAVAHDGYSDMYQYVRQPSQKKPLAELDAEPYMSVHHPREEELNKLLAASAHSARVRAGVRRKAEAGATGDGKRARAPVLFEVVRAGNIRSVDALQAHALAEAAEGRCALAEYCTRRANQLQDIVAGAWRVLEAPQRMLDASLTLPEKLRRAAVALPCLCNGRWAPGAVGVLERNGYAVELFTGAVFTALQLGAVRGANIACVGKGGCGKSTLLESLELVFACLEKPQAGSTFPLANIRECDVILWQDYEHNEGTLRFSDLLSMFVGESIGLRIPSAVNVKHRNVCPCFYSGRTPLQCSRPNYSAAAELNGMMDERFTTFVFTVPLPFAARDKAFPKCGRCAAAFYLSGERHAQHAAAAAFAPPGAMAPAAPATPATAHPDQASATQGGPGFVDALQRLCELHRGGLIDGQEFAAAKQKLLAA